MAVRVEKGLKYGHGSKKGSRKQIIVTIINPSWNVKHGSQFYFSLAELDSINHSHLTSRKVAIEAYEQPSLFAY